MRRVIYRVPSDPPAPLSATFAKDQGRPDWRDENMPCWKNDVTYHTPQGPVTFCGYVSKDWVSADSNRRLGDSVPNWREDSCYHSSRKSPRSRR